MSLIPAFPACQPVDTETGMLVAISSETMPGLPHRHYRDNMIT
jgi:hypothetical protein